MGQYNGKMMKIKDLVCLERIDTPLIARPQPVVVFYLHSKVGVTLQWTYLLVYCVYLTLVRMEQGKFKRLKNPILIYLYDYSMEEIRNGEPLIMPIL